MWNVSADSCLVLSEIVMLEAWRFLYSVIRLILVDAVGGQLSYQGLRVCYYGS